MSAGGPAGADGGRRLAAVGDLVEDVVVRLGGPIALASDTPAVVRRRRGGSAANVAASAALAGHPSRFIGQVGADPTGRTLVELLRADGAEALVRWGGRSGTIVVLVDERGERTMLSDRGTCTALADPEPAWLDGVHTLHVPLYSLVVEPLAATAATLVAWAHDLGVAVSIDVSSVAVMAELGHRAVLELLGGLRPDILLANEDEAAFLGAAVEPDAVGARVTVVKQGPDPAVVLSLEGPPLAVPVPPLAQVGDTTGAGDAFAAGFLTGLAGGLELEAAVHHGHELAAQRIVLASTL